MATTTINGDVKDFEIDASIRAGLDALTPEERRAVEEVIGSKDDFLEWASDPSRVFRLRPNDPYLALKVTPRLRLIYTVDGDRVALMFLTNQGFLDRYASMGVDPARSTSESWSESSHGRRRGNGEDAE